MLYRNPDSTVPASRPGLFSRLIMAMRMRRRRRMVTLDPSMLNPHLRRDLGLVDPPSRNRFPE